MLRATFLCVALCFSTVALAQTTPVQVVYVVDGSTLTTYDVDQQSLYATPVSTLTLPESTYPNLVSSPNGHFIYYTAYNDPSETSQHLWVYATDSNGSPQGAPVQQLYAKNLLGSPKIDPAGNFLYAVYWSRHGSYESEFTIKRFLIDPSTGKLSLPIVEAQYILPTEPSGNDCGLSVLGFNAAGNRLYDSVFCSYPHGGADATYNERDVNLKTGALGADAQLYSWDNSNGGWDNLQFVNNLLFDFVTPNGYQQGINSVDIYQVKPNVSVPLVNCTASMIEACGYFMGNNLAHPSGKYVFLGISTNTTQIEKVELSAHKLVDTANYIPYSVERFSPDGSIAYAANEIYPGLYIEIYGFNVATSAVTPGGVIYVPSALDTWFTASRH